MLCALPPAASAHVQPELAGHSAAVQELEFGTNPGDGPVPICAWWAQEQRSCTARSLASKLVVCRMFFGKKYRDLSFP